VIPLIPPSPPIRRNEDRCCCLSGVPIKAQQPVRATSLTSTQPSADRGMDVESAKSLSTSLLDTGSRRFSAPAFTDEGSRSLPGSVQLGSSLRKSSGVLGKADVERLSADSWEPPDSPRSTVSSFGPKEAYRQSFSGRISCDSQRFRERLIQDVNGFYSEAVLMMTCYNYSGLPVRSLPTWLRWNPVWWTLIFASVILMLAGQGVHSLISQVGARPHYSLKECRAR
jgi:hypothetical protein